MIKLSENCNTILTGYYIIHTIGCVHKFNWIGLSGLNFTIKFPIQGTPHDWHFNHMINSIQFKWIKQSDPIQSN